MRLCAVNVWWYPLILLCRLLSWYIQSVSKRKKKGCKPVTGFALHNSSSILLRLTTHYAQIKPASGSCANKSSQHQQMTTSPFMWAIIEESQGKACKLSPKYTSIPTILWLMHIKIYVQSISVTDYAIRYSNSNISFPRFLYGWYRLEHTLSLSRLPQGNFNTHFLWRTYKLCIQINRTIHMMHRLYKVGSDAQSVRRPIKSDRVLYALAYGVDLIHQLYYRRVEIEDLKDKKAPGKDDPTAGMIKALDHCTTPIVHSLVNNIFQSGYIPKEMHNSIVVTLPKKTKTTMCTGYRTLSLMSHL